MSSRLIMTSFLAPFLLVLTTAFAQRAPLKNLVIPADTRFTHGHSSEDKTNMFRYLGGNKDMSCSLNLNVQNNRLEKAFREVYENQVAYYTNHLLDLSLKKFDSQNVPYTYSYCVHWSNRSHDPEDAFCERYETVSLVRQYFTISFAFENYDSQKSDTAKVEASIGCIDHDVDPKSTPFDFGQALQFLKEHTDVIIQ